MTRPPDGMSLVTLFQRLQLLEDLTNLAEGFSVWALTLFTLLALRIAALSASSVSPKPGMTMRLFLAGTPGGRRLGRGFGRLFGLVRCRLRF